MAQGIEWVAERAVTICDLAATSQEKKREARRIAESPGRALGDRGFLFTRPAKWGLRIPGMELDAY